MQTFQQILLYLFLASLIGFVLAWFLRGLGVQQFKRDWLHESTLNRTLTAQMDQMKADMDASQADRMELGTKLEEETSQLEESRNNLQALQGRVLPMEKELETLRLQVKTAQAQHQEKFKQWQDLSEECTRLKKTLQENEKKHEQLGLAAQQKLDEQLKRVQLQAAQNLEKLKQDMLNNSPQLAEIQSLKAQLQANADSWTADRETLLRENQRHMKDLQLELEAFRASSEQQLKTLQVQHAQEVQEQAERHAQSMKMAQEHIVNTTKALEQERQQLHVLQEHLSRAQHRQNSLRERFKAFEAEILGLGQQQQRAHQFLHSLQEELSAN